jgi:uncharacterized protein YjbI with pentapeptide repeats
MTDDELKKIIERHEKWLKDQEGGERANLRDANLRDANLCGAKLCGADLCGANLCDANLRDANLRGANLCGAKLCGADLCGANLCDANLRDANLYVANLYGAKLCGADLRGANLYVANLYVANLCDADLCDANLCGANLCGADLCGANLCGANLCGANLCGADLCDAENVPFIPMSCPDSGSFTAWKKVNGMIVKLLISEDARRSSATGRKCRCDKAVVLAIETVDGEPAETQSVCSDYRKEFVYVVGNTVEEPNFSEDRFKGCAQGIHFFINRQEAADYN